MMRIFSYLLLSMVFTQLVKADSVNVGVSPPRIYEDRLLPGSHFEKSVLLSKSASDEDLVVTIDMTGQMRSWITIDKDPGFVFPHNTDSTPILFSIDVPADAAYGTYQSTANIKVAPENTPPDLSFQVAFSIDVRVQVSSEEIIDYAVKRVDIPAVEEGYPITISLDIENKGNVRVRPSSVRVRLMDKFNTKHIQTTEHTDILYTSPFSREQVSIYVPNNLSHEQYLANVVLYDDGRSILEEDVIFDVKEAPKTGSPYATLSLAGAALFVTTLILYHRKKREEK